jgi:hypothetical protein
MKYKRNGSLIYINNRNGYRVNIIDIDGFEYKMSAKRLDEALHIAAVRMSNVSIPISYERALYNAIYDVSPCTAKEMQRTRFDPWIVNINVVELLTLIKQ